MKPSHRHVPARGCFSLTLSSLILCSKNKLYLLLLVNFLITRLYPSFFCNLFSFLTIVSVYSISLPSMSSQSSSSLGGLNVWLARNLAIVRHRASLSWWPNLNDSSLLDLGVSVYILREIQDVGLLDVDPKISFLPRPHFYFLFHQKDSL